MLFSLRAETTKDPFCQRGKKKIRIDDGNQTFVLRHGVAGGCRGSFGLEKDVRVGPTKLWGAGRTKGNNLLVGLSTLTTLVALAVFP